MSEYEKQEDFSAELGKHLLFRDLFHSPSITTVEQWGDLLRPLGCVFSQTLAL